MPIYEFKCNQCDNVFSELRNMSETDPALCTECSSNDTRKLMSSFATSASSSSSVSSGKNCLPSGGG